MTQTLEDVKTALHGMDPELDQSDEAYRIALVLLAGLVVGADVLPVARFTGLDAEWVASIASRLTANDIWKDGITNCDWFDEESGGIAFWMDVAIGQGMIERA